MNTEKNDGKNFIQYFTNQIPIIGQMNTGIGIFFMAGMILIVIAFIMLIYGNITAAVIIGILGGLMFIPTVIKKNLPFSEYY